MVLGHPGDGTARGRYPPNCYRLCTLVSSSCVKSVSSHRDEASGGRHPRSCRRFWTFVSWKVECRVDKGVQGGMERGWKGVGEWSGVWRVECVQSGLESEVNCFEWRVRECSSESGEEES